MPKADPAVIGSLLSRLFTSPKRPQSRRGKAAGTLAPLDWWWYAKAVAARDAGFRRQCGLAALELSESDATDAAVETAAIEGVAGAKLRRPIRDGQNE